MLAGTVIESPVGQLTLEASGTGLARVSFGKRAVDPALNPYLTAAAAQLSEYFAGERHAFNLALDLQGTPFQLSVWALLDTIPYGETRTYGELARQLGDRRLARAVGRANGANPLPIVRPCHRVIGTGGSLTGFGGGLDRKAFLLDHEARLLRPTLFQE